eukprot:8795921-Heterocapsa_arctica.AAC.1
MPVDQANLGYASAFELFLEYGIEHLSEVFNKMMVKLNANRVKQDYTILNEINRITKANIIQRILGLGHIFRQQRHPELADMPNIVNCLEAELRFHDMKIIHKTRGQHPQPWNHVEHMDSEIMMVDACTTSTDRIRPGDVMS